jgi:trimeric autotransporter adhesin
MKYKIFFLLLFLCQTIVQAQTITCPTDKANEFIYKNNPEALKERVEFEKKTKIFTEKYLKESKYKKAPSKYVIPVVFHVYGKSHNEKTITYEKIATALQKLNEDFKGLNPDFSTVDPFFQPRRGTLDIEFKLAKIDPKGNCTNGVLFYGLKGGYGNDTGYDDQIKADAWDNYKYMNVYIQNDLYEDNDYFNSGVGWYPNTYLSDNNLARIVYNGAFLYGNTGNEFASVLTHEFGHYLNLIHTFLGGCTGTDQVDDTPKEDGLHTLKCTPGTNCDGDKVNIENYMGYNGANGCNKMFTQGQVARMVAALEHPTRFPLWQKANLMATGVEETIMNLSSTQSELFEAVANNGSISSTSEIAASGGTFSTGTGNLIEGTHYTHNFPNGITPVLTMVNNTKLTLTLTGNATAHLQSNSGFKTITFLPAAFTAGVNLNCSGLAFDFKFADPYNIFYVNMADINPTPASVWKPFEIEIGDRPRYGGWIYNGDLKLETYTKRVVCETGNRNVTKLDFNAPINQSSNFTATGATFPGQFDIRKADYTIWDGKTGYIGFEYTINNLPCYGWFKANVASDGKSYTITEYAYNTEPYGTIYAGVTPKVITESSPDFIVEANDNDGSFTDGFSIKLTTNAGTFTKSSGNFTLGTDFTVTDLPEGLVPVLTAVNNAEARLTFTGKAINNLPANEKIAKLTLLDPAVTGGVVSLETSVFNLDLRFEEVYGIYYRDVNYAVSTSKVWQPFSIEPKAVDQRYGLFVDGSIQNSLRFETYNKRLICNGTTRNITLLGDNQKIDGTSNMVAGGDYPDLHVVRSTNYTALDGKTGYIGFEYFKNNKVYYGWFKITVAQDGLSYSMSQYAFNTKPSDPIFTPSAVLSSNEFDALNNLGVAPNPFESSFTIDTSKLSGSDVNVKIVNAVGQEVYNKPFNLNGNQPITVDTEKLSKGLYFLQLELGNNKSITKKIIKN